MNIGNTFDIDEEYDMLYSKKKLGTHNISNHNNPMIIKDGTIINSDKN